MNTAEGPLFVIDDDPGSRRAVAALASSLKIKCETFASAEEFLTRCIPSMTGCALIDFRLPGMDGLQLLDRLRAMGGSLAVVLISAHADVSMAVRALRNGALTVLEKPYQSNDLIDVIREAISHSVHKRQSPSMPVDGRSQRLLACDLHDGVAQYLAAASMLLEHFQREHSAETDGESNPFQKAVRLLRLSLDEVRCLIRGTHNPAGTESLVAVLKSVAAEFADRLEIDLIHNLHTEKLEEHRCNAIYRILQESLTNVWRHSRSRKVRVEAKSVDGHVAVHVRDWGIGFDTEEVARDRFGLEGIRDRARLVGCDAAINSVPGKGTWVSIRIPHDQPAFQAAGAACSESASPPNRDV
jgi:signal transduction histidine kinase